MANNTSSSLSNQYQNYFSKQLLTYAVQELKLDQFAELAPLPKRSGHKAISMFRFDVPTIANVKALSEGTPISSGDYGTLTLSKIEKSLAQYGEVMAVTDILNMTALFDTVKQATKRAGQDAALWVDSVTRNVLQGSNLTASGASIGSAVEGSPLDNSDTLNERYAYGTNGNTTFVSLNSDANGYLKAIDLLDSCTELKINRAPEQDGGGYVFVSCPQLSRDLMRDDDWLEASYRQKNGQQLFKGEVGSLYGIRVVDQTNPFRATGSATEADKYVYANSGDIYTGFILGKEAYGIPHLTGESPYSPRMYIVDSADKSDPLNQTTTVGFKIYFTALRKNPNYYVVLRAKTRYA